MKLYLIGSLRNPKVPKLAAKLRKAGFETFDDWFAAGFEADDWWQRYEKARGHNIQQALANHAANHVYEYDKHHLDDCDAAVLLMPAGKSGHLELGYVRGQGKPVWIVMKKEPDRFDVMYRFAEKVCLSEKELISELRSYARSRISYVPEAPGTTTTGSGTTITFYSQPGTRQNAPKAWQLFNPVYAMWRTWTRSKDQAKRRR